MRITGAAERAVQFGVSQRQPATDRLDVPGGLDRADRLTLMVVDAVLNGITGIDLPGGALAWAIGRAVPRRHYEAHYSDLNNFAVTPASIQSRPGSSDPARARPRNSRRRPERCCSSAAPLTRDLDGDVVRRVRRVEHADHRELPGATGSCATRTTAAASARRFDPKLSLRWQLGRLVRAARLGRHYIPRPGAAADRSEQRDVAAEHAGTFRAIRTFGDPNLKPESALTFNVGMHRQGGRLQRLGRLLVVRLRGSRSSTSR